MCNVGPWGSEGGGDAPGGAHLGGPLGPCGFFCEKSPNGLTPPVPGHVYLAHRVVQIMQFPCIFSAGLCCCLETERRCREKNLLGSLLRGGIWSSKMQLTN